MLKAIVKAFFYVFDAPQVGGFCIFIITWLRLVKNLAPCEDKSADLIAKRVHGLLQGNEDPTGSVL
jgi:hypothetical protein